MNAIDEIIRQARALLIEANEKYDKSMAVDMDTPEAVTLFDDYKSVSMKLSYLIDSNFFKLCDEIDRLNRK